MFKYITIDGMVCGTGIRDDQEYLAPESLGLSVDLVKRLKAWHESYGSEFYSGYENQGLIQRLDVEGIEISKAISRELIDCKIEYLSDFKLERTLVSK